MTQRTFSQVEQLCMITALYLCFGAFMFSFVLEDWNVVDSLYFSMVTFCTVGYGDLQPSTDASRTFSVCYALISIVCLTFLLSMFGNELLRRHAEAVERSTRFVATSILRAFDVGETNDDDDDDDEGRRRAAREVRAVAPTSSWWSAARNELVARSPAFALVLPATALFGVVEGWDFVECLYFAVATATTTGYGDYAPTAASTRLLSLAYVPVAVSLTGVVLGNVAEAFWSVEDRKREERVLYSDGHDDNLAGFFEDDVFRAMDQDSDNVVTKAEFLAYVLVWMEKVDRETVDKILRLYRQLDRNGNGVLDREDYDDAVEKARLRMRKLRTTLTTLQAFRRFRRLSDHSSTNNHHV